jgi:hypothetical protein
MDFPAPAFHTPHTGPFAMNWMPQAQTDGGKLMEAVVHHVLAG